MDRIIIEWIMRFRKTTLAVLLIITAVFGYGCSKMSFFTDFLELFPKNHPYVRIHKQYAEYFGGANVATLVLEVKEGDIYNRQTLEKIVRIQEAVEKIPGVNPFQIFSLASRRVQRSEEIPGGLSMTPVMKDVPGTNAEMANLRARVFSSDTFGTWVSEDLKALRVQATFIEGRIDHDSIFKSFVDIRKAEENANHRIYLAGEPILYGWVYHYLFQMILLITVSIVILVALLYFFCGRQPAWWLPFVSALLSAVWGMGMSGYLGYQFDPLIIVVPFLLTSRAMSHGVQWLNRFGHELRRTGDVVLAAHTTGRQLFNPCVIGVVTDACGVLIVALIPIPILQHLAILGFFWGMSVIFTVSLFNPVFVSFLPLKAEALSENPHRAFLTAFMGRLAHFSITFRGKVILVAGSLVILAAGVAGFAHVPIGDANPGSPVLWPESDYNQGVARINHRFLGMEQMYILVRKNPRAPAFYPVITVATARAMDDLKNTLIAGGSVASGRSAADMISGLNRLVHGNDPKFELVPDDDYALGGLIRVANDFSALGDMDKYWEPQFSAANLLLFLRDHKGDTLKKVIADARQWIADPDHVVMGADADGKPVQVAFFEPAGGLGGILAAAIELIEKANHFLVGGILLFTFLCCAVVYRSLFAGFIFVISLVLANFTSFAYMAVKQIGLNINTVPVVSLGVGLGVDYGLYIVSRIKELVVAGAPWEKGIVDGVSSTGRAVFYQAVMMSASVFFWWFSPLRFQAEMGFLLAILMMVNMFVGVLLLPALIHMFKPGFILRDVAGYAPALINKTIK